MVAPVAVSQATQRAGRAGREGPGKCFRLYCEDAMSSLESHIKPELLRTNLGGVVLQLKAMGVDDILTFPFIDTPPREALVRSLELLFSLGALDKTGKLSAVGKKMSRFPLEPMAAKAIIAAGDEGCAEDTISSRCSPQTACFGNIRNRPAPVGQRDKNLGREQYARKEGDHVTLLEVFRAFRACGMKRRKGVVPRQRREPPRDAKGVRDSRTAVAGSGERGHRAEIWRGGDCAAVAFDGGGLFPEHGAKAAGWELQDGVHRSAPGDSPELGAVPATAGDHLLQRTGEDESSVRARRVGDPSRVARGDVPARLLHSQASAEVTRATRGSCRRNFSLIKVWRLRRLPQDVFHAQDLGLGVFVLRLQSKRSLVIFERLEVVTRHRSRGTPTQPRLDVIRIKLE